MGRRYPIRDRRLRELRYGERNKVRHGNVWGKRCRFMPHGTHVLSISRSRSMCSPAIPRERRRRSRKGFGGYRTDPEIRFRKPSSRRGTREVHHDSFVRPARARISTERYRVRRSGDLGRNHKVLRRLRDDVARENRKVTRNEPHVGKSRM